MTETLTPDMIAYLATSLAEMIAVMAILIGMALIACGLIGKQKCKPLFYHDYFEPHCKRTEEMKTIDCEQLMQLCFLASEAERHRKALERLSRECAETLGLDPDDDAIDVGIARSIVDAEIDVDTAVAKIIGEWANEQFDKSARSEVVQ